MVEVEKMNNALLHFEKELNTLRTSELPNMLDNNCRCIGPKHLLIN